MIFSQIRTENKVRMSPLISLDQIVVMDNGLHDCTRRKEQTTEAETTELSVRIRENYVSQGMYRQSCQHYHHFCLKLKYLNFFKQLSKHL